MFKISFYWTTKPARCAVEGAKARYITWSVVNVGHGVTFGGDMAQVDLLGLDLNLRAEAQSTKTFTCNRKREHLEGGNREKRHIHEM